MHPMPDGKCRSIGIAHQPSIVCNPHLPPFFNFKPSHVLRFGGVF
jgi:hypothetical protein